MKKSLIKSPKILIYSVLAVILTAFIGSKFTTIDSWYESVKPSITPPNIVFPIAWTTLFALIAIAMYLSLSNSKGEIRKNLAIMFGMNLVFNVLWSLLFFKMHYPSLAFVDLILLWFSAIMIMRTCWNVSKPASWLLLPYVLWLTFAGILNYLIAFT